LGAFLHIVQTVPGSFVDQAEVQPDPIIGNRQEKSV
jgi:hypothetical protein